METKTACVKVCSLCEFLQFPFPFFSPRPAVASTVTKAFYFFFEEQSSFFTPLSECLGISVPRNFKEWNELENGRQEQQTTAKNTQHRTFCLLSISYVEQKRKTKNYRIANRNIFFLSVCSNNSESLTRAKKEKASTQFVTIFSAHERNSLRWERDREG